MQQQQQLQQQVDNSQAALTYVAQQASEAADHADAGTAQLGQAIAHQREADSHNMATILQTFRTDMQGVLTNTIQQTNTQQTAEINNLRQEFEAQIYFSANIMT